MITLGDIRKYCAVGEDCELEFKDGRGGFPSKEFWRSYSAFANTNGGLIVLGVVEEQKQKRFLTAGLSKEKFSSWRKQFWDEANNPSKVNVSLLAEGDVIDVPVEDDTWLMVFRIPRADYRIRPVYINGNWQTGTYKRRHEGDYRCGVLKVEKHEDGYLFSNPGYLKIPVEAIYKGGTSRARNPKIQDMLRMVGYGDNIGTGFPTLVETWQKETNTVPVLEERQDLQLVNLRFNGGIRNTKRNTENTESNTQNTESNTELSGRLLEVWEFCKGEPKSSAEIFGKLNITKQKKHFDLYINPLLESGHLRYTKEGGKRIKGQRYAAVER